MDQVFDIEYIAVEPYECTEEEEEEDEPEAEEIETEANPYIYGDTSPSQLYDAFLIALLGVYYLCLLGVDVDSDVDSHQRMYDAVHVFANHMAKLAMLKRGGGQGRAMVIEIFSMIRTQEQALDVLFTHNLHNCINFESKHSSASLKEQGDKLNAIIEEMPPTSTKKIQKLLQMQQIDQELQQVAALNDAFIEEMKVKAMSIRKGAYPDHVYLRVFHELQLTVPIQSLEKWG
eukprot:370458_1